MLRVPEKSCPCPIWLILLTVIVEGSAPKAVREVLLYQDTWLSLWRRGWDMLCDWDCNLFPVFLNSPGMCMLLGQQLAESIAKLAQSWSSVQFKRATRDHLFISEQKCFHGVGKAEQLCVKFRKRWTVLCWQNYTTKCLTSLCDVAWGKMKCWYIFLYSPSLQFLTFYIQYNF